MRAPFPIHILECKSGGFKRPQMVAVCRSVGSMGVEAHVSPSPPAPLAAASLPTRTRISSAETLNPIQAAGGAERQGPRRCVRC